MFTVNNNGRMSPVDCHGSDGSVASSASSASSRSRRGSPGVTVEDAVGLDVLMKRMKSLSERREEFSAEEQTKRYASFQIIFKLFQFILKSIQFILK